MTVTASPLSWPAGWKRTDAADRTFAHFGKMVSQGEGRWKSRAAITIAQATRRVRDELRRMGIHSDDIVVSTNLRLKLDGDPYSDQRAPADPGVAVYWRDGGVTRTMAIDRYAKVEDNLAAVAATIEAMRAIERHGGAVILERAFAGFLALPAPGGDASARTWRQVLGFESIDGTLISAALLRERFRSRASQSHPDKGGTNAEMAEVNLAYEQAKQELGYV